MSFPVKMSISVALVMLLGPLNGQAAVNLEFEQWLNRQSASSVTGIMQNIASNGAVSASPSKTEPDYYFHWVRDSALSMDMVVTLLQRSQISHEREQYQNILKRFVNFSRGLQLSQNRSSGFGEPKFNMDGSSFNFDWGRPQNDGPALRAITLIKFAKYLITQSDGLKWVQANLYDSKLASQTVIKADLEFISHHWRESSYDLWEEVQGDHFYTRMVQRKALLDGAEFAILMGDNGAASWYQQQIAQLETEISKHWQANISLIVPTLYTQGGDARKRSGLDVAIVLAALQGSSSDGLFFSLTNEKILASSRHIRKSFESIYEINKNSSLSPAIGRYPEDSYDGYSGENRAGNPWVLSTCAFAEFHYRLASEWTRQGKITISAINLPFFNDLRKGLNHLEIGVSYAKSTRVFQTIIAELIKAGDGYLQRLRFHTPHDLSLSEQINRNTGFMQGAPALAWSYVSFLSAVFQRPTT